LERIAEASERVRVRRQAGRVLLKALLTAVLLTLMALALP
jgi:Tfp pilus assembly protein PilX